MLKLNLKKRSDMCFDLVIYKNGKMQKKIGSILLDPRTLSNLVVYLNIKELRFWLRLGVKVSERLFIFFNKVL